MKRFQWRIAICLVPVLGALAYLTPKFLQGKEGFKLGVDLVGGTILVYETERGELWEKTENKKELMERLAASIKRRIDPNDLRNITVRPVGENRVEIILPLSLKRSREGEEGQSGSLDDVASVKSLIKDVGSLEFRFLANERDDTEAITKAEDYFKDALSNKDKLTELEKRARNGEPPPAPEPPTDNFLEVGGQKYRVFNTDKGKFTYSWVELGRGERKTLSLDNESEGKPAWTLARDQREKGLAFRLPGNSMGGALFYSRVCDVSPARMPEAERKEKKYEYFVLTRDPERDPATGEPRRVSGEYLTSAMPEQDKHGKPGVGFTFNSKGGNLFYDLTSRNAPEGPEGNKFYRYLAIILDGKIVSAPSLNDPISTRGIISGRFTVDEVRKLVNMLRSGALPATLKPQPVSENTMGSTLGDDTIRKGTLAVGLAFVAVLAFMMFYYRFAGLVASVALLANLVLTVAAMVAVNATFTLPGLAGLVLMLGMAVDANVLIYERLREERDRGATLTLALRNGYDRALPTIIDTHLTSIFTAIVLWAIGNDQLKGFGISLTIGLVISLFTSLYMTRVFFDVWTHLQFLKNLSMARWVPHTNIDFMSIRHYWLTATVILTVMGLALFVWRVDRGGLNIDFVGGVAYGGQLEQPQDITDLRHLLDEQRTDASGQPVLALEPNGVRPLDAAEGELTRNYEVRYRGDVEPRRLTLTEPATVAEVLERIQHLPDLSLEMISVGAEDTGGKSRFFTARTTEKDNDVVRLVITRLLSNNPEGGNLRRILLKSMALDDNGKGATLEFDALASPPQVADLLRIELEGQGLGEAARQFEVLPRGNVVGGRSMTMRVEFSEPVDAGKLKSALAATQREFAEHPQPERLEKFDSHLAAETRLRALYAVLASWGAILLYLWFRFGNWTFGLAAVLCLMHDLIFTLGIIAACHYIHLWVPGVATVLGIQDFKIDFAAVASLLTLIGFSVNDTIVVFDRIREVRGKNPQLTPQMINDSVNQTLSRTLLTSFITWLVVLVLYIWGGEGVHLFAFVMVVGVVVGTYSSIYVASPLLLMFGEGTASGDRRERQPAPRLSPEGAAV